MTPTQGLYLVVIALFALERGIELVVSVRNVAWARRRGGVESGSRHYPWMVALHAALLVAAPLEVVALDRPFVPALAAGMATLLVASQALRWWCIATLGRRWSTRVVVVPGLEPVVGGPYRWLRHPNYLAVAVEVAALPLLHGAWLTALVASLLDAALLAVRIRVEEEALAGAGPYAQRFAGCPRLVPGAGAPGAGAPR